MVCYYLRAQR